MLFDPAYKLALGLLTGIVFGFLLQKGRVGKFSTILGQLLLVDWTVLKVMATAIVVGGIGVFALVAAGWASFHIQPFLVGGIVVGAVAFGIGMAVFGYCPGTSVAASGEGSRDAMVGVLGMLVGAGVFVASYSWLTPLINGLGDLGKVTLAQVLGVSPWVVVGGLGAAVLFVFWLLHRREHHPGPKAEATKWRQRDQAVFRTTSAARQ